MTIGGSYKTAEICVFVLDTSVEHQTSSTFKKLESIENQCLNEIIVLTTESTADKDLRE